MKIGGWRWLVVGWLLFAVGCAHDESTEQSQNEITGVPDIAQNSTESTEEIREGDSADPLIGEKVITTIDVTYETLEYQASVTHLKEIIEEHEAYMESSYETTNQADGYNSNSHEAQLRQGNFTIRIPAEKVNTFLAAMEGMVGTKISEQVGNQDATQTYYDTQSRIEVLQQKEDRLRELLAQATTIEDILAIEDNLTETVAEREVLQTQNDAIDDLAAYSSLNLTIMERTRVANRPGSAVSFWERAREAIVDSAYTFYYWLQDALIWIIYAVPYLVVLAGIVFLIWLIRKSGWWQKRTAKKRTSTRYFERKKNKNETNKK